MTFLNPGFLWALPLALLPLIIHLLNLRPYKVVYFSNLKFLENIQQQQRTRNLLKEILVLLMRILAIAALIIAFAQPVSYKNKNAKPCNGVVFYLDNSMSMSALGKGGMNIELAKSQLIKLLDLFPYDTKFMLLTNDLAPEQQRFYPADMISNMTLNVKLSPSIRPLSFIVDKIANLTSADTSCKTYVFLLSDFQKVSFDIHKIKIPKNWILYFIQIPPQSEENIAIDTMFFLRPYHLLQFPDSLSFRLRNYSSEKYKDLQVNLYINDTLYGMQNVTLGANEVKTLGFSFQNTTYGWNSGWLSVQSPTVQFDDTLYFSYYINPEYKILFIGDSLNRYIKAFYSQKPFSLQYASWADIPYSKFSDFNLIIIQNPKQVSSGLVKSVKEYVKQGGNVCLIPSDNPKQLNPLLSALGISTFQSVDTSKLQIGWVNRKNDVYALALENTDTEKVQYPSVRNYGIRQLAIGSEQALLAGKNGVVLLSEKTEAKGHYFVFSFALDPKYTDFVFDPLFVPTFYNIAILSSRSLTPYYIISDYNLVILPGELNAELLKLKGKNTEFIPPYKNVNGQVVIDLSQLKLYAGNYSLWNQDSLLAMLSYNYDRRESNLAFFTTNLIEKLQKDRNLTNVKVLNIDQVDIQSTVHEQMKAQKIWKLFVILALIFLFAEILFNRLL